MRWFYNSPSPQPLALAPFVPPAFIPCFVFTSCLPPSFTRIPFTTRCSSGLRYTEMYRENSHQDTDTRVKSSSAFLQGPCPASSPSITWPYCRRATDGLLAQNGSAADTKSLSRSRCLLPLDICPRDGAGWMGIGGGRQGM